MSTHSTIFRRSRKSLCSLASRQILILHSFMKTTAICCCSTCSWLLPRRNVFECVYLSYLGQYDMRFNMYCKSYWTWYIGVINAYCCQFWMTYWLTNTYCCSSAMTYWLIGQYILLCLRKDILLIDQYILLRLTDDILFGVLDRLLCIDRHWFQPPPILEVYPAFHNRSYRPKL